MKIMIVTPYFFPHVGGLENYVLNTAKGLHKQGHDVFMVTSNPRNKKRIEERVEGLRVIRLPMLFKLFNTPINPIWRWQLRKIIKTEKPSVINAHSPTPFISDMVIRVAGHVPTVLTYHNDLVKPSGVPKYLAKLYYLVLLNKTLRLTDKIIVTSEYYAKISPYLTPHQAKLTVAPPGIDSGRFNMQVDKKWLRKKYSDKQIVLFVGSMDKYHAHKGLDVLIKAVASAKKRIPNIQLIAVGDGRAALGFRSMAKKLGIANNVDFPGFVSETQLPSYYSGADILVLPSDTDAEGFGMVIMEAAACGTPAVGSKVGGIPSAIQDTLTGLLVEPGNAVALSNSLAEILLNPRKMKSMGREANKRALLEFTWSHTSLITGEVLAGVSGQPGKSIVNISHYPLLPADFGGSIRVINLNNLSSKKYALQFHSLSLRTPFRKSVQVNDAPLHFFFRLFLTLLAAPFWIFKKSYSFLFYFTFLLGRIPKRLKKALNSADLIIIEEPHLFRWIHKKFPEKKYLLNQDNVELDIEADNFKNAPKLFRGLIARNIFRLEKYALQNATHITAVSQDNIDEIAKLYNVPKEKISLLPNGCNKDILSGNLANFVANIPTKTQKIIKQKKLIVFAGSQHGPNIEALDCIEKRIAPLVKNEDALFLIIGAVAGEKTGKVINNIYYIGRVDDIRPYFKKASVAINPVLSGSGSNIKAVEYLGAGIATVSTLFGARGLNIPSNAIDICTIDDFAKHITALLENPSKQRFIGTNGGKYVLKKLTWESISLKYSKVIDGLI